MEIMGIGIGVIVVIVIVAIIAGVLGGQEYSGDVQYQGHIDEPASAVRGVVVAVVVGAILFLLVLLAVKFLSS